MKIYNHYILTTTILLLLTTVVLIALGQTLLSTFYSAYVIEALIVTELYVFNVRARRGLALLSLVLLGGFLLIVVITVINILIQR